jgi:biopolymer transport protein ExbB/TolQ
MFPIAMVLVVGLAISIERFIYLTTTRLSNRRAIETLMPLLQKQDYKAAIKIAKESDAPIAQIICLGIARIPVSRHREDIEYAMEEGVLEAIPRLEKRTQYLATFSNISTLLGLLGTIIGLIAAFTAVANADPSEKATLLSQSISVAMNCSAFGLISAIPLLLCHAYLQSKTLEIVDSLEMAGVKFLNILAENNVTFSHPRPTEAEPKK